MRDEVNAPSKRRARTRRSATSLGARVTLRAGGATRGAARARTRDDLPMLFIVSQVDA